MCLDGTGLANGDLNRNERKQNKAVCIYFEHPLASPNILKWRKYTETHSPYTRYTPALLASYNRRNGNGNIYKMGYIPW